MYLSRLILNPRSRQVRNELADPYEMHRTVCKAFPDANYRDNESSGIFSRRLASQNAASHPTCPIASKARLDVPSKPN